MSAPLVDIDKLLQADEHTDWQTRALITNKHQGGAGIMEIVAQVRHGHTVHYMTNGSWNNHSLLVALTEITGPATLYLSTYAMSETATRCIAMLKKEDLLRDIYCIIDNRSDVRAAGSLQLLRSISTKLVLSPCHAKVSVLMGEQADVLLLGSANYTENKRIETGVVIPDKAACHFHKDWITEELKTP